MSFVTKEWKDRIVEFAGRRKLTNVSDSTETYYDVERAEGTVSQSGDAFNATNMNDLEERISDEFDAINSNLTTKADKIVYSYNEIDTGKVWTNGKHIYRKCYTLSNPTHGQTIDASMTTSYVDEVLYVGGSARGTTITAIPRMYSSSYYVDTDIESSGLLFGCVGYSVNQATVIIEYTKA